MQPLGLRDTNRVVQDRFIPVRKSGKQTLNFGVDQVLGQKPLLDSIFQERRVLDFSIKKKKNREINFRESIQIKEKKKKYQIDQKPIKVLEAPGLIDDYYLNLVSWGKSNVISVGLEDSVYFFNFLNNQVTKHIHLPQVYSEEFFYTDTEYLPYICSVTFDPSGRNMAVSDSNGQILITDVQKNKIISNELVNTSRIGSLDWQGNLLVSGSRDKMVRLFDVRQKFTEPVYTFAGHIQEICGLKFSPDQQFIASGGNDNQLLVWDIRNMKIFSSLGDHQAAIKALAWNPKRKNILVSGAGTSDRNLRIFDVNKNKELFKQETGSQVCNVTFDQEGEVLLSTHGYSLNQLIVWDVDKNFSSLNKEDILIAHKLRVLYLSNSPCGKYVVTGAGDETLRIWNVFQNPSRKKRKSFLNSNILRMR